MRHWLTPGRIGALIVVVAVVVLVTTPFYTPPAHEIHTPGATALSAQVVESSPPIYAYQTLHASQSLDDVRCQVWRTRQRPQAACPDTATLANSYFPGLTQSPMTLYIPLMPCTSRGGGSDGFNVEFLPSSRTLVIHCYAAKPVISTEPHMQGVTAVPPLALLLVSTQSIPAGDIAIDVDVRVEHLFGDDSNEYRLMTATIS
jgi:hypothetical protein